MGDNIYLSDDEQDLIVGMLENEVGHLKREAELGNNSAKRRLNDAKNIKEKLMKN